MLQRIAAEKTVDVFGYVMTLRGDRNIMVQVEEQYVFIHEVLLEAIHSGYTEVQANDLRGHIKNLMQVNPTTGGSILDYVFIIDRLIFQLSVVEPKPIPKQLL